MFHTLKGKTILEIKHSEYELLFVTADKTYIMHHPQDCCEDVYIESIVGDLDDLIGTPIVMAEEVTNSDEPPITESEESYTWTFYKLATIKGYVDIRWYGSSNGYYSESVSFDEVEPRLIIENSTKIINGEEWVEINPQLYFTLVPEHWWSQWPQEYVDAEGTMHGVHRFVHPNLFTILALKYDLKKRGEL